MARRRSSPRTKRISTIGFINCRQQIDAYSTLNQRALAEAQRSRRKAEMQNVQCKKQNGICECLLDLSACIHHFTFYIRFSAFSAPLRETSSSNSLKIGSTSR